MTIPRRPVLALLSLQALTVSPALGQADLPFPCQPAPLRFDSHVVELASDPIALAGLTGLESVTLEGLPMPTGTFATLELQRSGFDPSEVGVFVDGRPAEYVPGDLTLWNGHLSGNADSNVFLALSSAGSYGWIRDGVTTTHVSSFAPVGGSWEEAHMRLYTEEALAELAPVSSGPGCATGEMPFGPPSIVPTNLSPPMPGPSTLLECKVAIETDTQLFQNWGNLQATETYVMALLAAVSDRYEEQINVRLTFPYVQFYTTMTDPWTTQESGGGSGDLLNEFQAAWAGNLPMGAHLGHFVSGASLGGGVAWVGTVCNPTYGFAVSGNINGGVGFPVTQGGNTWDFFVIAHELGHNFGSPHTHNYCPPLDECADNCNGQTACTTQGTNMSYCHGCPGGMTNITTYFHPTVAGVMRAEAESACLPDLVPGNPVVLFADDFESGDIAAGGWTVSSSDSTLEDNPMAVPGASRHGNYGVRVRHNRWIEKALDTTGHDRIVLEVWRKTKFYEPDEVFRIRYHDGATWMPIEATNNPGWAFLRFELGPNASNNPNLRIRFRSVGNETAERGDIDDVVITGEQ